MSRSEAGDPTPASSLPHPPRKPRIAPRAPARIPVEVEIVHAWSLSAQRVPGEIWDVSQSGAKIRLSHILPPHTHLRVILPSAPGSGQVTAEVVWTSAVPGAGRSKPFYGLRWVSFVSQTTLDAILTDAPR